MVTVEREIEWKSIGACVRLKLQTSGEHIMDKQHGFTLIELIITMTIAAIVLAIGVPSFQGMMRNNRAAAHMNEFISALNLARSEAVKRGVNVGLVPNGGWAGGWTVFVDTNANLGLDAGEELRVYDRLEGNPTIDNTVASIIYLPSGAIIAGGVQQINYTLDSSDPTTIRRICISPIGRPSIGKEHTACP
jgi:type IV fimbrial biogenesis protein FimT